MKIEDSVFVYRLSGGDRLSWHGRYHAHSSNEFEIHYFIEGSGQFLCNKTRYPIANGTLFLSGPLEFHSIIPESLLHPISWYAFLFSFDEKPEQAMQQAFFYKPSDEAELKTRLLYALAEKNTVQSINSNFRFQFEDLYQLARSPEPALQGSAKYLLTSFLWRWFARQDEWARSKLEKRIESQNEKGHIERIHVEKALSYMQKQVRENLKIETIAKKMGISPEHFIRIFKNHVHITPGQYFTRLKVEGASGLLMSSNKTVGEISDWFGFENQFHFSKIFRKCTGMSPLEYRKTYLQTVDFT